MDAVTNLRDTAEVRWGRDRDGIAGSRRRVSDLLVDLALPRTDAGAFVQAAIAVPIFGIAVWRVRHNHDIRAFVVVGLATLTFAWFALRTLH